MSVIQNISAKLKIFQYIQSDNLNPSIFFHYGLEFCKNFPLWTPSRRIMNHRKKIRTVALILATFFNPLGFDALFALVMKWTGSYWATDLAFYCLSLLFFGLYFWLSDKPIRIWRIRDKK